MRTTELTSDRFLLAQLRLSALSKITTLPQLRLRLEVLAGDDSAYDEAYTEAMERIKGQPQGHCELAIQTLSWISCAKRPLAIRELGEALAVEPDAAELGRDNIPDIEDTLSVCGGLVVVDEQSQIIRLMQ